MDAQNATVGGVSVAEGDAPPATSALGKGLAKPLGARDLQVSGLFLFFGDARLADMENGPVFRGIPMRDVGGRWVITETCPRLTDRNAGFPKQACGRRKYYPLANSNLLRTVCGVPHKYGNLSFVARVAVVARCLCPDTVIPH